MVIYFCNRFITIPMTSFMASSSAFFMIVSAFFMNTIKKRGENQDLIDKSLAIGTFPMDDDSLLFQFFFFKKGSIEWSLKKPPSYTPKRRGYQISKSTYSTCGMTFSFSDQNILSQNKFVIVISFQWMKQKKLTIIYSQRFDKSLRLLKINTIGAKK